MRKKINLALVAMMIVFAGSAACSDDKKSEDAEPVAEVTPTSITVSDPEEGAKCALENIKMAGNWQQLLDMMNKASDEDAKDKNVRKVISTGRDNITSTRNWVDRCSRYWPTVAAEYSGQISMIEQALNELERRHQ